MTKVNLRSRYPDRGCLDHYSSSRVPRYCVGSGDCVSHWEVREVIHEAFLRLACAIICVGPLANLTLRKEF